MSKKAKLITGICVPIACVIILVTLLCVFLIKEDKPYTVNGEGNVSVVKNADGTKTMTASPNKWNHFVGWYLTEDGQATGDVISSEDSIIINEDSPNYTAVFKSSALDSVDRLLSGVYQKYADGIKDTKDYFNFGGDIDLTLKYGDELDGNYNISAGGYFNFQGKGNQFYIVLKDKMSNMNMVALYYVDNGLEAEFNISVLGSVYSYTFNMPSLSSVFTQIPELSPNVWSIENIINGAISNTDTAAQIYATIEQFLGVTNAQGFYGEATNSGNKTVVELRLGVILKNLSSILANLNLSGEAMDIINNILDILTGEYEDSMLPSITLKLEIDYQTNGDKEYVDTVGASFAIDGNYNISFGEEVTTIENTNVTAIVNNIVLNFADTANAIDETVIAMFPDAINLLNMYVGGELTFLTEEVVEETSILTATDVYNIELYADLNPFALISAITDTGFDATKIDWENLGFLSLRVYLDHERSTLENHYIDYSNTPQTQEQVVVDDFINIYIDTEKYGANAFAFVGGYKPYLSVDIGMGSGMSLAENFIFNNVINLPATVEAFTKTEQTQALTMSETELLAGPDSSQNVVLDIIMNVLQGISSKEDADKIIYTLISQILDSKASDETSAQVKENLSYSENYGTTLKLQFLRDMLSGLLGDEVAEFGLRLDSILFGDSATHMAIMFDEFSFGDVAREKVEGDSLGDYLNNNKESIFEKYNEQHDVIMSVDGLNKDGTSLEEMSFSKETYVDELLALTSLRATSVTLGDGTMSSVITNITGSEPTDSIGFKVLDVKVNSESETSAEVTLTIRRSLQDTLGTVVHLGPMFKPDLKLPEFMNGCLGFDDMFNNLGLQAGIYTYTTTINFAA